MDRLPFSRFHVLLIAALGTGDEQPQRPQQVSCPAPTAGAGIVIPNHRDETRTDDSEQRPQTQPPVPTRCDVMVADVPSAPRISPTWAPLCFVKGGMGTRGLAASEVVGRCYRRLRTQTTAAIKAIASFSSAHSINRAPSWSTQPGWTGPSIAGCANASDTAAGRIITGS